MPFNNLTGEVDNEYFTKISFCCEVETAHTFLSHTLRLTKSPYKAKDFVKQIINSTRVEYTLINIQETANGTN